ncbi:hypothetical protein BKP45_05040 [Anaerobacillus alkalidiazotrophicus]|uniref:Exonuclease domain-containing protein n=1 Tax=Anaerobacillus alkalidiazotrophicus TaxID=472963 RepID=A0A1S2MBV9_9BACI|nr:3'-5' exonuclease [Anaerobacillus alkalidiazotrophicus]OIJ22044.1 hypothetical protein BKP45_05040 [Anaerobacillus alkalidiazotrophicus]
MLNDVVVFDVETTGLSCKSCRVIELAAVKVQNGVVVDGFNKLVKIEGELPEVITKITGITKRDLDEKGLDKNEVFTQFKSFIGNSLLVAHNAAFDLGFLHYGFKRNGLETFNNDFIDTLTISRDRHYYPHKLEDMCERYNIELKNAHRALADVIATFELLTKLHEESPVNAYLNTIGYLSKYGEPEFYPTYAKVFPTENQYEKSYSRW